MNRLKYSSLAAALLIAACGGGSGEGSGQAATEAAAGPGGDSVALPRSPAPADARLFFITPADGATVSNPFRVEFGLEGMQVAKAGVDKPNSGHHHLIIDAELPDPSMPIPANDNYRHFGDGSTTVELTLEPGTHTLRLILGDHLHVPHDPPVVSDQITVTVE